MYQPGFVVYIELGRTIRIAAPPTTPMLSISLRQSIAALFAKSSDFKPLLDLVESVAQHYDESEQYILGHSEGGDKLNQAAAALQSRFTSLYSVTRTIAPRKVYDGLAAFMLAMQGTFGDSLLTESFPQQLAGAVEQFISRYDAFLMQQNASNAAALMLEASKLNRTLETTFELLRYVNSAIDAHDARHADEDQLSIIFYQSDNLTGFITRLSSLQELYSELCMLLQVSEATHPLRVGKLESGSLWVKVFGDTKVIQLVASLIESTVGYLHRRFTTEGKIGAVPKKLEALDGVIQLSAKLTALGVDTSEMNEHLRKSGVTVARSLATLLEDQPRVTLNDRLFTVGASIEPLFISQEATLKLPSGVNRIDPTLDDDTSPPPGAA